MHNEKSSLHGETIIGIIIIIILTILISIMLYFWYKDLCEVVSEQSHTVRLVAADGTINEVPVTNSKFKYVEVWDATGSLSDEHEYLVYDVDTKVMYVRSTNGSYCPLYNADGSIMLYDDSLDKE